MLMQQSVANCIIQSGLIVRGHPDESVVRLTPLCWTCQYSISIAAADVVRIHGQQHAVCV